MTEQALRTPRGAIRFPAFLPVTTFGSKFPLDEVVRPYLGRFATAIMVSYHYAEQMKERPESPLFVDSGGFASLFEGSAIVDDGEVAAIRTRDGTVIHPAAVLAFQEATADAGATLDFLTPPSLAEPEARLRQDLTVRNALWALRHRSPGAFRLFASVQAWDVPSARRIMEVIASQPFDGFALGGMVPRTRDPQSILAIVQTIREIDQTRPLHVFGIGQPQLIRRLFSAGVSSVDSSSYVRFAADTKYLVLASGQYKPIDQLPETLECSCPICRAFPKAYLALEGELNAMALALHNLITLQTLLGAPVASP